MFSIVNLRDGAFLTKSHGCETEESLTVPVSLLNSFGTPVRINGIKAEQDGLYFHASVPLTQKINTIEAVTRTSYGEFSQKITVVWDKKSFRRCCFYLDDHIFTFTELAKQRPRRAFDHFYLAALKKLHERYGIKMTLNCFYHNDHQEFELKDMPDIWKQEFADNADWLRFAFHARTEFPDRPYVEVARKTFIRDFEQVHQEVVRFAGESSWIAPQVIHWGNLGPGVAEELIKRGCCCYSEAFRPRLMSAPPEEELTPEEAANRSEVYLPSDEAMARQYGFGEEISYMGKHGLRYDAGLGVFFLREWIVCNLQSLEQIPRTFAKTLEHADRYDNPVFAATGHEQYSFPSYFNYQKDHLEKLETAIRLMVEEAGCKPVFVQDGLLGNNAWN